MSKAIFFIIIFVTIIIFPAFVFSQSTSFEVVLHKINDQNTKNKLVCFRRGGVELPLDLAGLNPDSVVRVAKKYLGTPHRMGGTSRKSIDCSGLLYAVFRDLGKPVAVHSSQEMARYGKIITNKADLQKGDLIFFIKSYKPRNPNIVITHSGIVIDDGKWIHTSRYRGVVIDSLHEPSFWNAKFLFGTRLFADTKEVDSLSCRDNDSIIACKKNIESIISDSLLTSQSDTIFNLINTIVQNVARECDSVEVASDGVYPSETKAFDAKYVIRAWARNDEKPSHLPQDGLVVESSIYSNYFDKITFMTLYRKYFFDSSVKLTLSSEYEKVELLKKRIAKV